MANNGLFVMSSQELDRKEILDKILKKELTQVKAANILCLTDRRIRKLLSNYKKYGIKALISKKRGKRSNRAYSEEFRHQVINLITSKYPDFGPTFACEKLYELDKIKISHEKLRKWMISADIYKSKSRKKAIVHQSRERRSCFGELVQIDGSHHDWFEGRRDKCCLLVFIDDATSSLLYCRFEEAETT